MKLSFYIDLILTNENQSALSTDEKVNLDGFDDAILMLDDLQDNSESRNGQPAYYIAHGLQATKDEAKRLNTVAFKTLRDISTARRLSFFKRWEAASLLKRLKKDVETGQGIDSQLQQIPTVNHSHMADYQLMIRLFTGGHVKIGFLLGFLLANTTSPEKKIVSEIGEQIGILRQMDDDICDYFESHHEPFGDLIQHKKRLPELLFLLGTSKENIQKLNSYLENSTVHAAEIRKTIFSDSVKKQIREIVDIRKRKIEELLLKTSEKYRKMCHELMEGYLQNIESNLKKI